MPGEHLKSSTSDAILISGSSQNLLQMLGQLGIQLESHQDGIIVQPVITRKACEAAGVSFEFFQAFANLTGSQTPKKNWGTNYFESRAHQLDRIEVMHLVQSLWKLDKTASPGDHSLDTSALAFNDLETVKSRINLLAKNSCWLGAESLQMGLFQSLDALSPKLIWFQGAAPAKSLRISTDAMEFGCQYLPAMEPIVPNLSYQPKNMPPAIQKAADSTVELTIEGQSGGTGFLALYPGYILTARHVLGAKASERQVPLSVRVIQGEKYSIYRVNAEVVQASDGITDPDFVILYVGQQLPAKLSPLQFATDLDTNQKAYVIGLPAQQMFRDVLVQTGVVDLKQARPLKFHTSAVAYPGDSGGPIVDWAGQVIGLTVQVSLENEDVQGGFPRIKTENGDIETAKIMGTYGLRFDMLGPRIRQAIEAHSRTRRP